MKRIIKILLSFYIAMLFYSCGDNPVNNSTSSGQFILSGTIENWVYGENIKLKAFVIDTNFFRFFILDSSIVSNQGAFSLKFNIPPDSLLFPITSIIDHFYDTSWINNITISPPNTKASWFVSLGLFNDDSMAIGYIYKSNHISDTTIIPGQYYVYYIYLNENASVIGSEIYNNEPYHDTIFYNISGVRGWNKLVYTYNSMNETVSTNEPLGSKWYATVWRGDALSGKSSLRGRMFRMGNYILKDFNQTKKMVLVK